MSRLLDELQRARDGGYRIVPWSFSPGVYDSVLCEGNIVFLNPGIAKVLPDLEAMDAEIKQLKAEAA